MGDSTLAIPFRSPSPRHRYWVKNEVAAIDALAAERKIPKKSTKRLLLASWNVANLGAQDRTGAAQALISHILGKFDLIAVQEVNEEFRTFADIVEDMDGDYEFIMTDTAGNAERLAFVYDAKKVQPRRMFGELALREYEYPKRTVKVEYRDGGVDKVDVFTDHRYRPFDRNPAIGTFSAGAVDFTLVNVHLYFGAFGNSRNKIQREKYARRVLEIFALSKWADRRANRKASYDRDIILTGDMNVPSMTPGEDAYEALIDFGFKPVDFTSKIGGSNLGNDKTYDQMAFAPGAIDRRIRDYGVFDFDNAVFAPLWAKLEKRYAKGELTRTRMISLFTRHVKHHISDHRPLWTELDIS